MIGESKPNFALDLSNDGIALWHRASDGSWKQLGDVRLDDPDFSSQVTALRDGATGPSNRARRAVVRIPRSEVMLNKVRLGVFEGEAAARHARKQIDDLTPYAIDEVVYDLGEKGFGNMAPVGIVAHQTLVEADAFAKAHGFNPVYFTTQYNEREFPREPKFYLAAEKAAAKPMWFVPWVAAASVGLTIGYFGYSYLTRPATVYPTVIATATEPETPAPAAQPEPDSETVEIAAVQETNTADENPTPATDTVQLGLQDIAPNLPAVQLALAIPDVTAYPELQTKSVTRTAAIDTPRSVRLKIEQSDEPTITVSSKQVKTSALQIAEARRDLPEVAINDEIAQLIQNDLNLLQLARPTANQGIKLAALTAPTQTNRPVLVNPLPPIGEENNGVSDDAATPADRPPPPVSLVTAEPGTLTPTPEGTLGPGNILIFSGPPDSPPLARPGTVPPLAEQLAGFRPRYRPEGLAPVQPEIIETVEPETVEPEPLSILELADPTLRGFAPSNRPDALKPIEPAADVIAAAIADDTVTQAIENTIAQETAQQAIEDTIAQAAVEKAIEDAIEEANRLAADSTLLALADPTLANKKSRNRPDSLRIIAPPEDRGLLAFADPSLARKKARNRPRRLRIIEPPKPEPVIAEPAQEAPAIAEPTNTLSSATKHAVARSPKPKKRPTARLARVVKRVAKEQAREDRRTASNSGSSSNTSSSGRDSATGLRGGGGTTRATARTPRSAIGSSKPSPGPTTATVARAATEKSKFRKSRISLVGVFGTSSKRRALVRLPSGKYVKVQKGDKVSGWQISAIGESSLRIKKGSRDQVLRMP